MSEFAPKYLLRNKPKPNQTQPTPTKSVSSTILGTPADEFKKTLETVTAYTSSEECPPHAKMVIELLSGLLKNACAQSEQHNHNKNVEEYRRERSVVIAALPESQSQIPSERVHDDRKQLQKILNLCEVEAPPICHFRMGEQKDGKPRLIKLELPTRGHVRKLMANRQKLSKEASLKNVHIRPSLSYEDRQKWKELVTLCSAKRNETKKDFVIYAGEIIERGLITPKRSNKRK